MGELHKSNACVVLLGYVLWIKFGIFIKFTYHKKWYTYHNIVADESGNSIK